MNLILISKVEISLVFVFGSPLSNNFVEFCRLHRALDSKSSRYGEKIALGTKSFVRDREKFEIEKFEIKRGI